MSFDQQARPRLPRHVKFRFDPHRQSWVLLGPERVLMPDEVAVDILKRCDGETTVETIVGDLARTYQAQPDEIAADVMEMLRHLSHQGMVQI